MTGLAGRDFLDIDDLTADELRALLDTADEVKRDRSARAGTIAGRHVAMLFEKPSTRTRVSFHVAVTSMGGHPVVLRSDELQLGRGEPIEDTGRVLSRYVDAIVLRTSAHERLVRLAEGAGAPVINALSDFSHPCQCLADMQTIREKLGRLEGVSLAYIGDGNNVAHSLMVGGAMLGMDVRIACPPRYEPAAEVIARSESLAGVSGGHVTVTDSVADAVAGADVLYTDVWSSMGQEGAAGERARALAGYGINERTLTEAADGVIVMHCLPAHRGEEITSEVLDGPHSVVWEQAENRLHSQKALLVHLLS